MDEKNVNTKLPIIIRILIPILIIAVIIGLYFWKNTTKNLATKNNNVMADRSATSEEFTDTAAYPLKISAIDLKTVKSYGVPTVIDFGSDSCIPCKEMAPVLEKLNSEWQNKAAVQFFDVWKYSDGIKDFPIQVIPTQVFFNADGTPFVPSDGLQKQIAFTMYSSKETGEHIFTVHQGGITEAQMRQIFAEMGVK